MKRSEMIELMADSFIKHGTLTSTTMDKMIKVLRDMEAAGMMPPPNIEFLKSMVNAPPSMFSYISPYFWDKED